MAIDAQFVQREHAPYVHSNIYHFNTDVQLIDQSFSAQEKLESIIANLEQMSTQLRSEAESFLGGRDYKEVSSELFDAPNTFRGIALKVVRNPDFGRKMLNAASLDVDSELPSVITDLVEYVGTEVVQQGMSFRAFAEKVVEKVLPEKGKSVKIENSALNALFSNVQSTKVRVVNSPNFKKEVARALKKVAPINVEKIWAIFVASFREYTRGIEFTKESQSIDDFLEALHGPFIQALQNANIRDPANVSGWLGEDFKNALWTTLNSGTGAKGTFEFDFINVGSMTERALQTQVLERWGQEIKIAPFGTDTSKSHSDWVLRNSSGKMVRAQDKNSSTFLTMVKTSADSIPQPIKLQDTIKYLSLQDKLRHYTESQLSEEDWTTLDYLMANTVWFSRFSSQGQDTEGIEGSVAQARDVINRILAEEIGYFTGVADIHDLNKGANNTFFVIDNVILYPTYLIIDYIIHQLKKGADQLNRLQVTIDVNSVSFASGMENASAFYKAKLQAATAGFDGTSYDPGVLDIGSMQGDAILNSLQISRINLRFDIKTILTTAYNFDTQQLY